MTAFEKLWDYSQPAATEQKFREALNAIDPHKESSVYLQLLTQIARTYSLRGLFDEAHTLLNDVQQHLSTVEGVEHIRYKLERGRAFNSSGKKTEAQKEFTQAAALAEKLGEDFYLLDALHMLAITAPATEAVTLNEQALLKAENTTDERARGWLGALYNNLGWGYFDMGQYEKALSIFLRALQWREQKQQPYETFLAKWCVARTLRALNRLDEAIKIQLALMEEMIESSKPDGYVYEELGELYLLKGEEIYKMYFDFAWKELSTDEWLVKNEAARLQRMKDLSK